MGIVRNSPGCACCDHAAARPLRTRHSPGELLPRHRHAQPFAAIVLKGDYVEAGDSGRHRVGPGDVLFHAPFESHLDRFGSSSAEVLVLPVPAAWDGSVVARIADPDEVARLAETDAKEALSTLLAGMAPRRSIAEDWPDLLAAHLLADPALSLGEWSASHQLHKGSLSRGFRQQFGITPAEFRVVARTRRAIRRLRDFPLSEAAVDSGFADQAHMTRTVKRLTGLSPARLRAHLLQQYEVA